MEYKGVPVRQEPHPPVPAIQTGGRNSAEPIMAQGTLVTMFFTIRLTLILFLLLILNYLGNSNAFYVASLYYLIPLPDKLF